MLFGLLSWVERAQKMIELLFGLGVYAATVIAIFAVIQTIPSVVTLLSVMTNSTDQVVSSITDLIGVIEEYAAPWVGLLNMLLPQSVKTALLALVVWRLVRPIGLNMIEMTTGASRKILEKLM